jgi:hypothetical protein
MSAESLIFHLSRSGELRIFEPSAIPHFDDPVPLMAIAVAVLSAGYQGIAIDERRLANGRYCQCLEVDLSTPEGKFLQELSRVHDRGGPMPRVQTVLDALTHAYAVQQKHTERGKI